MVNYITLSQQLTDPVDVVTSTGRPIAEKVLERCYLADIQRIANTLLAPLKTDTISFLVADLGVHTL